MERPLWLRYERLILKNDLVSNLKVALKHYGSHGYIVYIDELDIALWLKLNMYK